MTTQPDQQVNMTITQKIVAIFEKINAKFLYDLEHEYENSIFIMCTKKNIYDYIENKKLKNYLKCIKNNVEKVNNIYNAIVDVIHPVLMNGPVIEGLIYKLDSGDGFLRTTFTQYYENSESEDTASITSDQCVYHNNI